MQSKQLMTPMTLLALVALAALPAMAAAPMDAHAEHRAAAAASSAEMSRFDDQVASMRALHARMSAAKTPEERAALMKDHMAAMHAGMAMMAQMPGGMEGMGAKGDMPAKGTKPAAMNGGMPAAHEAMHHRMEMMEVMMQMMMDRQDAMPMAPAMSTPSR